MNIKYWLLFQSPIPDCYKALIESCWTVNPKNSPSFDEIVNILIIHLNYQASRVDKDEFLKYVNCIELIKSNPDTAEDQSNTKSENLITKVDHNLNENTNQNLIEKEDQNYNSNEDQVSKC